MGPCQAVGAGSVASRKEGSTGPADPAGRGEDEAPRSRAEPARGTALAAPPEAARQRTRARKRGSASGPGPRARSAEVPGRRWRNRGSTPGLAAAAAGL